MSPQQTAGPTDPGDPTLEAHRMMRALATQLLRGGMRHVVIAPGSRSTPITLAMVSEPGIRSWLHLDERSAGYFALGLARQLGAPVGVVCTSGTAAANLLPAVAEASLSRVPLVLLTADRPPELHDVGANQTIVQPGLFGAHAKWAVTLPVAGSHPSLTRHGSQVGARAAATAREAPAGPVHINVPLREPLVAAGWDRLTADPEPAIEVRGAVRVPDAPAVSAFLSRAAGLRGLIVCGPESAGLPAREIVALAEELGWPVLADPLSGLRAGKHRLDHVIGAYDALLRVPAFARAAAPEAVLRFGAAPTSKALAQFLQQHPGAPHAVVDKGAGWRDPDGLATLMLHADPASFATGAVEALRAARPSSFSGAADDPARTGGGPRTDPGWLALWQSADRVATAALEEARTALDEPFEGSAPSWLASALPEGATLVVGNSMPVRDLDSFLPTLPKSLRIVGTRGASGIDGVVSTAVGAAAAEDGRVALLLGDLSLLHDINGLWPLRRYGLSLTVLVVNNDGGGIFHFLPQAELAPEHFEEWFGTPHGVDLAAAVAAHGGRFETLEAGSEEAAIRRALARPGLDVLELRTDRVRNVALHREVWARVEVALKEAAARDPALAALRGTRAEAHPSAPAR